MPFFGSGNRPGKYPIKLVEVDSEITAYRFGGWDPSSILLDLQAAMLEATEDEQHLWDSNERLQMYSVATWLAATRQITADTLLLTAESSGNGNRVPVDVAETVRTLYRDAQKWIELREEVNLTPDYVLTGPVSANIRWPQAGVTVISHELFEGLKTVISELFYVRLAKVQEVIDGPYLKAIFRSYKDRLAQETARLGSAISLLDQRWSNSLDPNESPGKDIYSQLVLVAETIVMLGVYGLMPVTHDPKLKLKNPVRRDKNALPDFNAEQITRPTIPTPSNKPPVLPPFDPETMNLPAAKLAPVPSQEPPAPTLPAFDPSALLSATGNKETPPPGQPNEVLPPFDPSLLFSKSKSETDDPAKPEYMLPPFNPEDLKQEFKNRETPPE